MRDLGGEIPGCILDTNFLIAALYDPHPFHEDAEFVMEKLEEHKIPIFATVTTRAEFIDIQRRIIITEVLLDLLGITYIDLRESDTAYAVLAESNDKIVLVPNSLYKKKLQKLKI